MKIILVSLFLVLLSGCSTLSIFTDKAGEINDEALNAAEFTICYGASVGSVRRHYGDLDKSKIWQDLCNITDDFKPELLEIKAGGRNPPPKDPE